MDNRINLFENSPVHSFVSGDAEGVVSGFRFDRQLRLAVEVEQLLCVDDRFSATSREHSCVSGSGGCRGRTSLHDTFTSPGGISTTPTSRCTVCTFPRRETSRRFESRYEESNETGTAFGMRCGYTLKSEAAAALEAEIKDDVKHSYAQTDPDDEATEETQCARFPTGRPDVRSIQTKPYDRKRDKREMSQLMSRTRIDPYQERKQQASSTTSIKVMMSCFSGSAEIKPSEGSSTHV